MIFDFGLSYFVFLFLFPSVGEVLAEEMGKVDKAEAGAAELCQWL